MYVGQDIRSGTLIVCLLFYFNIENCAAVKKRKQLFIGGMFPLGPNSVNLNGSNLLSACKLAVEMVNNRTDILPNYKLNFLFNNTKCNEGTGTHILIEYFLKRPPIIMLLGAGCSSVSRTVSQVAWQWNLVQVSYASTGSELSNKHRYPLFFRVIQPDSTRINAAVSFLKYYKWNRIALLGEDDQQSNKVILEVNQELLRQNFSVITSRSAADSPKKLVHILKEKNARIIITLLHEDTIRRVFCEAYKVGMYSPKYVWLDLYGNSIWRRLSEDDIDDDCTNKQWLEAASGQFFIDSVGPSTESKTGVSGKTSQEMINILSQGKGVIDSFSSFAFDAVWVVALSLHKAAIQLDPLNKTLDTLSYEDQEMAKTIKTSVQELSFHGVTGRIEFDQNGDRIAPVRIVQLQNGLPTVVASYDSRNKKLSHNNTVLWQGSTPLDGQRFLHEVQHVAWPLFWCLIGLTICCIILAFVFLICNLVYRKHSYINLSSPTINNLMLFGAIFIYSSIFLILLDSRVVKPSTLPYICSATGFILGIGYSLFVGAMFSKTWRIYQIFNKVYAKRKVFKDSQLCGMIVVFVVVDTFIFTLMSALDPFILTLKTVGESKQNDITTIYQYQYCSSKHITTWFYVILGYKALILLVGCFFAIVTRKVKARALNDSQYVAASISIITVAAFVGTPLIFLLLEKDAVIGVLCFSLILPTTGSLCLIFIPKIYKIRKNSEHTFELKSLSAMRNDNDFINQSHDWPNGDVSTTIMRLQIDLAKVKKELREQKALNASGQEESIRCDDLDTSTPDSSRRHFNMRSKTCQNLAESPKLQPTAHHHKRNNTISVPAIAGSLSFRTTELNHVEHLQVENSSLRRKLRQTKINEAGKMCKVLYENADLNRKIVELQSSSNSKESDKETVSRLMKENNELKRQLGEVGILNSVYCDMTPRMARKVLENDNCSSSKPDLRELQHLLTVDLGGGRASSFGPSRSKRPPTIGLSQSSLDLLDPKENHNGATKADNGVLSVSNQEQTNRTLKSTEEQNAPTSDVCQQKKNTSENEVAQKKDTRKFDKPHPVSSTEDLSCQQDNKGFQDDQELVQTNKKTDLEVENVGSSHEKLDNKSEPLTKDNSSLDYETSKTKELLKKGKVSVTNSFDFPTTKKESQQFNEQNSEPKGRTTFEQAIIKSNNSEASDSPSQSPSLEMIGIQDDEDVGEHCLINRKRRKSKKDRETKIEKVEKTFFV